MFDRLLAQSPNPVATQRSLLDLEVQTALELQLSMRTTNYAAHRLLSDALCASPRSTDSWPLRSAGPISGDHVRQIAERDDAVIHEHRLDDLLEPDPAVAQIGDDLDEAAVHRKGPRPDSPDECRADDAHPHPENRENDSAASDSEAESASSPRFLIAKTALPSDPYRPNLLVDLLARLLWGTCSIPGCERAAFACDLDHVAEFDNICPDRGGPTCLCNLLPKCRFHHLMKTNLEGFVDEWPQRASGLTRTEAKHARRRAERNSNRDRRLAEEAKLTQKQVDAHEAGRAALLLVLDPESEPPF